MPYASLPSGKTYFETHGSGEPLLLHPGFGCTVEIYWRNTSALAEQFRVIVFDPRGAGRSDDGPATMTMTDFAADAADLLAELGVDSTHLFGTSFGGMVAQHIALDHPERVRRLVLACTTPGGAAHVLPPVENLTKFIAASDIPDPIDAMRSTYALNYSDRFIDDHDALLVERARANEHLRSTPEGRASQLHAVQKHDTNARLHEVSVPTFIAHGTEDGTVPVENGKLLANAIPGASLKLYPGGRHLFFTECADELNRDIAAFLRAEPDPQSAPPLGHTPAVR
jgi:pimeloyl-ACP methyl ester carboxylesterase